MSQPKNSLSLTESQYLNCCEGMCGLCLDCFEITEGGVEPDARGYLCEACGAERVCGLEEALLRGKVALR